MVSLSVAPISGQEISDDERNRLREALGNPTCTNNVIARAVDLFSLAFAATLIFLFLSIPPVACWFVEHIPSFEYRLIGKALLFFALIYIVDMLTIPIRADIDICDFTWT